MDQQAAAMSRMRSSQPSRRAAGLRRVVALRDRARALIWWSGSSMRDSVVDGKGTVELKTDDELIECDPDALSFAAANDTTTLPLPAPASKLAGDRRTRRGWGTRCWAGFEIQRWRAISWVGMPLTRQSDPDGLETPG